MSVNLKAGVSLVDISPGRGHELAGYPHCPRYNTGIHDPLYAGCIFLDDGRTKLALITLDLLFYSKKFVNQSRKRIAALTGIPAKNVMFCCSHTHSGPWGAGRLDLEALEQGRGVDFPYVAGLQDKLDQLVLEACNHPFDAKAGLGKGFCGKEHGIGGNRRDPDGPADPEVCVLGIQDFQGNWRGCLVVYALHPTVIHGESTKVSADYPGYLRRYLLFAHPGMVTLFAQGTSGDQSTRYFRDSQTFEEACRIGTTLGVEVHRVLDNLPLLSRPELMVRSVEAPLQLRDLPDKTVAESNLRKARTELERVKNEQASYVEVRTAEVKLLGAEDILGYALMAEKGITPDLVRDELPAEIQVLGIGDRRIVGIQGEIFVEYGLAIKQQSPFDGTFVIELANGALPGYMYSPAALIDGGYEVDTSMLDAGCGDWLITNTLKLLQDTKG
jgi:neutral ceramidase